jgi:hypothetical protein
VEANLIPHVRRIVDRFVATRSIEKTKTVGRPPVNEEIVEDLRQRMEQNLKKKSLRKLSLQTDVHLLSKLSRTPSFHERLNNPGRSLPIRMRYY